MKTPKIKSKRILFCTAILFLYANTLNAQKAFYYYQGQPYPLVVNQDSLCLMVADSSLIPDLSKSLDEIQGTNYTIHEMESAIVLGIHTENARNKIDSLCSQSPWITSFSPLVYNESCSHRDNYVRNTILYKPKAEVPLEIAQNIVEEYGYIVFDTFSALGIYMAQSFFKEGLSNITFVNELYETGLFDFVNPDFLMFDVMSTNDPYYYLQWYHNNTLNSGYDIQMGGAWSGFTSGSSSIKIALLDNPVYQHSDLNGKILTAYDAAFDTVWGGPHGAESYTVHGTACAGIMVAEPDNEIGITGIAPGCKVLPIIIRYGGTSAEYITRGLQYAVTNGADVINCSWNCLSSDAVSAAINNALRNGRGGNGCVVVCASGNSGSTSVEFPADVDGVIAVGAMSQDGRIGGKLGYESNMNFWWVNSPTSADMGSSYGDKLWVVAPGTSITTLAPPVFLSSEIGTFDGTSLSSAQVAAISALMLSFKPDIKSHQVRQNLAITANKVPDNGYYTYTEYPYGDWCEKLGYGLVQATSALDETHSVFPEGLVIRDNANDYGFEPNYTTSTFYNSPDVWLTTTFTGGNVTTPSYGQTYNVKVKLHNYSNRTISFNANKVVVYWTVSTAYPQWGYTWHVGNTYSHGSIVFNSQSINLPAGDSITLSKQFSIPNYNTTPYLQPNDPTSISFVATVDPDNMGYTPNYEHETMTEAVKKDSYMAWRRYNLSNNVGPFIPITNTEPTDQTDTIVSVSPNPASQFVNIKCNVQNIGNSQIYIRNYSGVVVFNSDISDVPLEVSTSSWPKGWYKIELVVDGCVKDEYSLLIN